MAARAGAACRSIVSMSGQGQTLTQNVWREGVECRAFARVIAFGQSECRSCAERPGLQNARNPGRLRVGCGTDPDGTVRTITVSGSLPRNVASATPNPACDPPAVVHPHAPYGCLSA